MTLPELTAPRWTSGHLRRKRFKNYLGWVIHPIGLFSLHYSQRCTGPAAFARTNDCCHWQFRNSIWPCDRTGDSY